MNTIELLNRLNACEPMSVWAQAHPDLAEAWTACERTDWLLWLSGRRKANRRAICELACDFAEHALRYATNAETRRTCADTIAVARAYLRGEATLEQLRVARDAAYAAYAAPASASAAYAAYAASASASAASAASAAYAAYAAADAADAAYAASASASAAASAAAAYADADAERRWQRDHIREVFTAEAIVAMFTTEEL